MGLYFNIALFLPFDKIEYHNEKYIVKILEVDNKNENYNRYLARVIKVIDKKNLKGFKCYLDTTKDNKFKVGNIILVKGMYERGEESRNYKGFNYREYLIQKKIYGIINLEEATIIESSFDLEIFFYRIKESIKINIENIYKENNISDFLSCILIGEKIKENNIKEDFRNSNLSHILAISGMHVSYIIMGINLLKVNNKRIIYIIEIVILIFYLIITGCSVSCLRACFMNILLIISKIIYRKNNIYLTSFYVFLFSIIYNLYNIKNAGMWLSFGGMLGIILFQKFIYKFLIIKFKVKNKIIKKIIEISSVSISAQILILPITIYFFNIVSLNFIISNLATYYLIGPIIILGYISIILCFLKLSFLVDIIKTFEEILVKILLQFTDFISKSLNFNFYIVTPSIITLLIYYILVSIIIIIFKKNKFKFIRILLSKNKIKSIKNVKKYLIKNFKYKKYYISFMIIIFILSIFYLNSYLNLSKELKINFVDVGQGDCCTIITPQNKKILIDGGEGNNENKYDYGKNVLFPYLLDKKINKIDYIFISHFDSDHVGGILYILKNMKVNNIIIGKQFETTEQYEELKYIAKKKKINIHIVEAEKRINIEKNIYFDILWPCSENVINENSINNNSLVFKLVYKNISVLFTGDIEEVAENEILNKYKNNLNILESFFIKVAHHGSKSSSSEKFLNAVNPKVSIINVGENNNFGHPSIIVLDRIKNKNCKIYRTDKNGEISIKINKEQNFKINEKIKED